MSTLIPASGGTNVARRREGRAVSRDLARLETSTQVSMARIEHQAQREAAKIHAVSYVGQQALHAVAMVSQLEGQLGQACPMAVTRLLGIADMTAMAVAQVVAESVRKIGD